MRLISIIFLVAAATLASPVFSQQIDSTALYRLTNDAAPGRALSISGTNTAITMISTSDSYDQLWKIISIGGGKYRIVNATAGDGKSLDNRKSGDAYSVVMGTTGNYSGQSWTLTAVGSGKYRLSNDYAGMENSLDSAKMTATGDSSGQMWKLTKATAPEVAPVTPGSRPTRAIVAPVKDPVPVITDPNKVVVLPIQTGPGIDVTPKPAATPANNDPALSFNNVIIPWDPNKIPRGGTLICNADLRASGNCGFTKADWVGKHEINLKCEKGFYDPIWGGTCWDFPKDDGRGTWVRGTTEVTADDAVWRAPKEALVGATKVKTTGWAGDCGDGTFWDGWSGAGSGGAGCYSCPTDHPRRTANPVYTQQACASVANETAKAVFLNYNGCPKPDPGTMGLTGKRMPGKPFLDIGGGGCYACPNADETGNIIVTDRNGNSVKTDQGCTVKFKWKAPDFPEPGMAGLIGVKEVLLENLIFQSPDILTLYFTQVAKARGLQPGTDGSRNFVQKQWEQFAAHPYASQDLSSLVFSFLERALTIPANQRTPAEQKLVASMEEYVRLRRTFIAEQTLAMYDAWQADIDKKAERRAQSENEVLFDYGTLPLDFHAAALAGFGMASAGAAAVSTIVGANRYGATVVRISREQIAAARAANKTPEELVEAIKMAAREETLWKGFEGLKAFRTMSTISQIATAGPAVLIEVAGIILQSIAIDQFIKIQEARPKLLMAVDEAKKPVDLRAFYSAQNGKDELTYFWAKAMDIKTVPDDPELVNKAQTAMKQASQANFQVVTPQQ